MEEEWDRNESIGVFSLGKERAFEAIDKYLEEGSS